MHDELELLTLDRQGNLHTSMDCLKHIYNEESSLNEYFVERSTCNTRSGDSFELPELNMSTGQQAYLSHGPDRWNRIKAELKQITIRMK